jgi:hypothetical protein
MTNRTLKLLVTVLSLAIGANALGERPDGPPGQGGRGNPGDFGDRGRPSRQFGPPDHFVRPSDSDWPPQGRRFPRDESRDPRRNPGPDYELDDRVVALSDAVSMVQSRFNATAVKTDTVTEAGQLVYRIRLLSADRSRVWTVTVDARTGRIN